MDHDFSCTSKRVLSLFSLLGIAAASAIAFSWLASGPQAQAQAPAAAPATGGLVNPPGASIARPPLQLDPSTWEPCKHITNGPENVYGLRSGMLCPPSISTGTPAISGATAGRAGRVPGRQPRPGRRSWRGPWSCAAYGL